MKTSIRKLPTMMALSLFKPLLLTLAVKLRDLSLGSRDTVLKTSDDALTRTIKRTCQQPSDSEVQGTESMVDWHEV